MYIRTYDHDITSSPEISNRKLPSNRNLATATPQGINLQKLMTRKSLSKYEKSPVKDQLQDGIKIVPGFYQSNSFGVSLKNNRIRQLKTRGKNKDRVPAKVKEELMNILQQNIFKLNKEKSLPNKKAYYSKRKSVNFTVSGRPASRDCRVHDKNSSVGEFSHKGNQTVLDFSKLTKIAEHNFKYSENKLPKYSELLRKTNIYEKDHSQTQPQILIDYRRSMSSGRKRSRATSELRESGSNERKQEPALVIRPWAVKGLEQDEQLTF